MKTGFGWGVATVLGGAGSVEFGGDVTGKDLVSVIEDSDCPSRGMWRIVCMDSLDLYRIKLSWIVILSGCAGWGGSYVGAVDGLPETPCRKKQIPMLAMLLVWDEVSLRFIVTSCHIIVYHYWYVTRTVCTSSCAVQLAIWVGPGTEVTLTFITVDATDACCQALLAALCQIARVIGVVVRKRRGKRHNYLLKRQHLKA